MVDDVEKIYTLSQRTERAISALKGSCPLLSGNDKASASLMFATYAQALRDVASVRERKHVTSKNTNKNCDSLQGYEGAKNFLNDLIYLTQPSIKELDVLGIDYQFVLRKLRQFEVIQ